jgi:hypothetical protein
METPWPELETRVRIGAESTTEVTLRVPGRGVLEGRLVLARGTLPPYLLVFARRPLGAAGVDLALVHCARAADGVFRLEGLAAGPWELSATLSDEDDSREARTTVELGEGERRGVELSFP